MELRRFSLETESSDEDDEEDNTESDEDETEETEICVPKMPSDVLFPSLMEDKSIRIRNAYVDGQHICSEFILMIEHKETIAISCFTRKMKKIHPGNLIRSVSRFSLPH